MSLVSKTLYFKNKANNLNRYRSWRLSLVFVAVGFVLFGIVWWPIQAERARIEFKNWEEKISQKKSELNDLQNTYKRLTSLNVLDQWAKRHGPWKSPTSHDVISL